ncbi:MAG: triose-phosphate isomerase [Thermacetogeniaceae bacterium]
MKTKRMPLIAGNWKMNKTPAEAGNFAKLLRERVTKEDSVEVLICPPFPALAAVASELAGSYIAWGAQNMHWETKGAYTGEVSAPMLQALGCRYVILGHSERRTHFGETDEVIANKLVTAVNCGLCPILCLGEKLEIREAGKAVPHCLEQLKSGLSGIREGQPPSLVVAYEPVWAIGTGKTATPEDAVEVIKALREQVAEMYGEEFASQLRFLYGGSVTPESTPSFMNEEEIDGLLVGGASLNIDKFVAIIQSTAEIRGKSV